MMDHWVTKYETHVPRDTLNHTLQDLERRYSEKHRFYHNLRHIEECLAEFSEVEHIIPNPFEVWLAIWFHDAVYDPKVRDNEERSSLLAERSLETALSRDSVQLVSQLIHSTKHDSVSIDSNHQYLADIDLSILGQNTERFTEYEMDIRREYSWVAEDRFKEGRMEILKRFLERSRIYQTCHFYDKYEKKARENLTQPIKKLKRD